MASNTCSTDVKKVNPRALSYSKDAYNFSPIGLLQSVFPHKNGTPRQPTVCSSSRASLTIDKSVFNNPEHSLEGLEDYSHVWILFVFHLNNNQCTKSKVKPPRLDGRKLGLFATRCPYRPVPVGLTLAKIERIQGATIYLSGIDIINGTPILDIKPYIPEYDSPSILLANTQSDDSYEKEKIFQSDGIHQLNNDAQTDNLLATGDISQREDILQANVLHDDAELKSHASLPTNKQQNGVQSAKWLEDCDKESRISRVEFTPRAAAELTKFQRGLHSEYALNLFASSCEAKAAIKDVLLGDPRSSYRRKSCCDRLYYFSLDSIHITCWFDGTIAEVVKVQPAARVQALVM